jgi:mersacidin/lichenicidin family type 2 lantibiotic
MSRNTIIRAWKDAAFRQSLSLEERASLPEHPAGRIELSAEDLGVVVGGLWPPSIFGCSFGGVCNTGLSWPGCEGHL